MLASFATMSLLLKQQSETELGVWQSGLKAGRLPQRGCGRFKLAAFLKRHAQTPEGLGRNWA